MSSQVKSREYKLSDTDFEFISELVYTKTGIVLAAHKRDMVYSRLARRLRILELDSFSDYCIYVVDPANTDELGNLVNAITTNLTRFFRENHHFDHLRDNVIRPMIASNRADKKIRIWSAGCSTGAEPYSIAMVLAKLLKGHSGWDVKILATDIDTNMLAIGRDGIYRGDEAKDIPEAYGEYFKDFTNEDGNSKIMMSDALKKMITFNPLNLLEDWPMKGQFDIVFCRNVVIYFDKATQTKLFDRYGDQMKQKSWLYIGHSENLFGITDRFKLQKQTIYDRVK